MSLPFTKIKPSEFRLKTTSRRRGGVRESNARAGARSNLQTNKPISSPLICSISTSATANAMMQYRRSGKVAESRVTFLISTELNFGTARDKIFSFPMNHLGLLTATEQTAACTPPRSLLLIRKAQLQLVRCGCNPKFIPDFRPSFIAPFSRSPTPEITFHISLSRFFQTAYGLTGA
jgi:hypothetical protein